MRRHQRIVNRVLDMMRHEPRCALCQGPLRPGDRTVRDVDSNGRMRRWHQRCAPSFRNRMEVK